MTRILRPVHALVIFVLLAVGLPSVATAADDALMVLTSDGLVPQFLMVEPGTTVTIRNDDSERRRPRTIAVPEGASDFDADLDPGDSFQVTLTVEGVYQFQDTRDDDDSAFWGDILVTSSDETQTDPQQIEIGMEDRIFTPAAVSVPVGSTVTWINDDSEEHTVTSVDGLFNSGDMAEEDTFSWTFDRPGDFQYICALHSGMVGRVVVSGDAPEEPEPEPTGPEIPSTGVEHQVAVGDNFFDPTPLEATVGDTVVWTNNGSLPHTATDEAGGTFDSGMISSGGTYRTVLRQAGTLEYVCIFHNGMTGTIQVAEGDGSVPLPEPQPEPEPTTPTEPEPEPTAPGEPAIGAEHQVAIGDDFFDPAPLEATVGDTVVWTNGGDSPHTVTTTSGGNFDSGMIDSGGTYRTTLTSPGTIEYECIFHSGMTGEITVAEGDGSVPPPEPEPTTPTEPEPEPTTPTEPEPTPPTDPPTGTVTYEVTMTDNVFTPTTVNAEVGDRILWRNSGGTFHTATSTGTFDSGILATGLTYAWTPASAGTYEYVCILHQGMTGTIVVTGGDGEAPPSDPTDPQPEPTTPTDPEPEPEPEPTTPPQEAQTHQVEMRDNSFAPSSLTATVGDTVVWRNAGAVPHTATAGNGAFDSSFVMTGGTFSTVLAQAGTIEYACVLHQGMTATITVEPGSGDPSGAPAPAPNQPAPNQPAPRQPGPNVGGDTEQPPRGAKTHEVDMNDNVFAPKTIEAREGDVVIWTNQGAVPHTATARDGSFDSQFVNPGGTFRRAFKEAGTFNYDCVIHSGMSGTVLVKTASGGAPPPPAPDAPRPQTTAGGSDTGSAAPASVENQTHQVKMQDNRFAPQTVNAIVGDVVVWQHEGAAPHTATAKDGSFDSGMVSSGGSFRTALDRAGTFEYICEFHPGMEGTILVSTPDGGAPPPPAPSTLEANAGGAAAEAGEKEPGELTIRALDFEFDPASAVIEEGTEVTWVMAGVAPHTVTADDGSFDSGMLPAGENFTQVFDEIGQVAYKCELHPGMVGVLEVVAAGTDTSQVEVSPPPGEADGATGTEDQDVEADEAVAGTRERGLYDLLLLLALVTLVGGGALMERRFRQVRADLPELVGSSEQSSGGLE